MLQPDSSIQQALDLERDFAEGVFRAEPPRRPRRHETRDARRQPSGGVGQRSGTAQRAFLGEYHVNADGNPRAIEPESVCDRARSGSCDRRADRKTRAVKRQGGVCDLGSEPDIVDRYSERDFQAR
jgi:hypothetical protein